MANEKIQKIGYGATRAGITSAVTEKREPVFNTGLKELVMDYGSDTYHWPSEERMLAGVTAPVNGVITSGPELMGVNGTFTNLTTGKSLQAMLLEIDTLLACDVTTIFNTGLSPMLEDWKCEKNLDINNDSSGLQTGGARNLNVLGDELVANASIITGTIDGIYSDTPGDGIYDEDVDFRKLGVVIGSEVINPATPNDPLYVVGVIRRTSTSKYNTLLLTYGTIFASSGDSYKVTIGSGELLVNGDDFSTDEWDASPDITLTNPAYAFLNATTNTTLQIWQDMSQAYLNIQTDSWYVFEYEIVEEIVGTPIMYITANSTAETDVYLDLSVGTHRAIFKTPSTTDSVQIDTFSVRFDVLIGDQIKFANFSLRQQISGNLDVVRDVNVGRKLVIKGDIGNSFDLDGTNRMIEFINVYRQDSNDHAVMGYFESNAVKTTFGSDAQLNLESADSMNLTSTTSINLNATTSINLNPTTYASILKMVGGLKFNTLDFSVGSTVYTLDSTYLFMNTNTTGMAAGSEIKLPQALANSSRIYIINNITSSGDGNLIINPYSGDSIGTLGSNTEATTNGGDTIMLISDGGINWAVVGTYEAYTP